MSEFAAFSEWQAFSSGLVKVALAQEDATLAMRYDFGDAGGFVVARREWPLQLPERFRFRLRLRGEGQPNRLEVKLVDPTGTNVWWFRRAAVQWSGEWESWLLESRDFEFAWGPAGGGQPSDVAAVEVAIVAEAGGAGILQLAELTVEDLSSQEACVVTTSGTQSGYAASPLQGHWRSTALPAWITLDLKAVRAISALRVAWESDAAALALDIDGRSEAGEWQTLFSTTQAGANHSDIFLGLQLVNAVRLRLNASVNGQFVGINALELVPVERARSLVEFLHDVARREPAGVLPKYLRRLQSYWTVFGAPDCHAQGLINEEGMIEVQRAGFALEPFVLHDGRWLSWADARHSQSLDNGFVPVPSVLADFGKVALTVSATAVKASNFWCAWLRYEVKNAGNTPANLKLALLARPFQVVPPWQSYREFGGVHPIHRAEWMHGALCVDRSLWVIPQRDAVGNVRAWLQPSFFNVSTSVAQSVVDDPSGLAQAEMIWDLPLAAGESRSVFVAVPFDAIADDRVAPLKQAVVGLDGDSVFASVVARWRRQLEYSAAEVPAVEGFMQASRTSVAHILLNRDGAAIQPGPRRYARSWIRDGATMCAALLRTGNIDAVGEFLAWYAGFLREDGFVPCCVDREGVDWLVEHDSHGQWMHAVAEYARFGGDSAPVKMLVKNLLPSVIRAGQYVMALRASRLTDAYVSADATPELVGRRGLIPESVSHEGYLAQPVHSYWDSFWALKGLEDGAQLCRDFGERHWAEQFTQQAVHLRKCIRESIAQVIETRAIPHVPGSVEWADADPTASACAVGQLGEKECFPAEALRYTFDGFLQLWRTRMADAATRTKYSAYDIRVINALLKLGRRKEAWEIARIYLDDRRPCAWNQWPEISWPDPQSPGHLGDLPHSWIGAEFVLAVRALFMDEQQNRLVIGQGIQEEWLMAQGISLKRWPTGWGELDMQVQCPQAGVITLTLAGAVEPPGGIEIDLPIAGHLFSVEMETAQVLSQQGSRINIVRSPVQLTLRFHSQTSETQNTQSDNNHSKDNV